jgi:hypothetical protein
MYRRIPSASMRVAMKGVEVVAGSCFRLWSKIGSIAPMTHPMMTSPTTVNAMRTANLPPSPELAARM